MGGSGRKTKSSSSSHHKKPSTSTAFEELDRYYSNTTDVDLFEVSVVYVGWKKLVLFLFVILICFTLSVGIGSYISLSITIQYIDQFTGLSLEDLLARERLFGPYFRFTLHDQEIARVSNNHDSDRLHRAITHQNKRRILMDVVEPIDFTAQNLSSLDASESPTITSTRTKGYYAANIPPPSLKFEEYSSVKPKLCSDGSTLGFDSWSSLKGAIQAVNAFTAESFIQWTAYHVSLEDFVEYAYEDESLYYAEIITLNICPNTKLRAKSRHSIYINGENLVINGNGASFDASGGTHFAFGSQAKNVLIRDIHFLGARTSSLTFYEDGAQARLEHCFWQGNFGVSPSNGRVADINTTVDIGFYLCDMNADQGSVSLRFDSQEIVHVN